MVWWNQRKFQKSKFHLLTGINICTRFSTSQHNEQNLHCWASSFQHLLFPKNKQRHRKKNPPQKKKSASLVKSDSTQSWNFFCSDENPLMLGNLFLASCWTNGQIGVSSQLPTTRLHQRVGWCHLKSTTDPSDSLLRDGNEATSGSADKFMLQKKSPFLPGSLSRRLSLCPSCTSVLSVWVKWELLKGKRYKADDRGPARENSEVAPGVDDYYHYDSPEGWWTLLVLVCRSAAKTMLIGGEKDAVFMGKWQPVQSNQVVLT